MTDAAAKTPVATDIPVPAVILAITESKERQLVWCFVVFFSRMEYALKRCSPYLKSGTKDAQPNWDTFGSRWDQQFAPEASEELKTAVEYFIKEPPRKQLCDGNTMRWSEPQLYDPREPRLCWLLRMIRCVRNNLFHGGKFPIAKISDPSRDRELLMYSLTILQSVLELDAEVKNKFYEDIE